jgi:hypothetical protein
MKKLLILAVGLALVPIFVPANADALTLATRVSRLEAKMSCVKRVPMGRYQDFAWFGIDDPRSPANQPPDFTGFDSTDTSTWPSDPLINWGQITGLDLAYGVTPGFWTLAISNTSTCRARFPGVLTNPGFARSLARNARAMHLRQLARVQ